MGCQVSGMPRPVSEDPVQDKYFPINKVTERWVMNNLVELAVRPPPRRRFKGANTLIHDQSTSDTPAVPLSPISQIRHTQQVQKGNDDRQIISFPKQRLVSQK